MQYLSYHLLLFSIIEHNGGSAPVTFEQFLGVLSVMGPPDPPAGPVRRDRLFTTRTRVPTDPDYDQSYAVPTLSELGNKNYKVLYNLLYNDFVLLPQVLKLILLNRQFGVEVKQKLWHVWKGMLKKELWL